MIRLCLFVGLFFFLQVTKCENVQKQNSTFTMRCKVKVAENPALFLHWKKTQADRPDVITDLGTNQYLEPRFADTGRMSLEALEEGSATTYTFTIKPVRLEDAGNYSCFLPPAQQLNQQVLHVHEPVKALTVFSRDANGTTTERRPNDRFELANGAPCTLICSASGGSPRSDVRLQIENYNSDPLKSELTTNINVHGHLQNDVGLLHITYQVNLTTMPIKINFPSHKTKLSVTCSAKSGSDPFTDKKVFIYRKATSSARRCTSSLVPQVLVALIVFTGRVWNPITT